VGLAVIKSPEQLENALVNDIPYRMIAVHSLPAALRMNYRYGTQERMEIYISNKLAAVSNANSYINPAIESGILHGRALLEFLGLCESEGKLVIRKNVRPTDIIVEDFKLDKVSLSEAVSVFAKSTRGTAEQSLLALIQCANKGIAHTTVSHVIPENQALLLTQAANAVIALVEKYLYVRLNRKSPVFHFEEIDRR
jgi:hypothetical protein